MRMEVYSWSRIYKCNSPSFYALNYRKIKVSLKFASRHNCGNKRLLQFTVTFSFVWIQEHESEITFKRTGDIRT
jgi:hypothetical protein